MVHAQVVALEGEIDRDANVGVIAAGHQRDRHRQGDGGHQVTGIDHPEGLRAGQRVIGLHKVIVAHARAADIV